MAQHEKDPAATSHDDDHAFGAERLAARDAGPTEDLQDEEAIVAPDGGEDGSQEPAAETEASAAPPKKRKNRQFFTLTAAALGLLATAGAIGAYGLRDSDETAAQLAAALDDAFAQPEKLGASLKNSATKWLGEATKTFESATSAPPSPPPPAEPSPPVRTQAEVEAPKPAEPAPPEKPPAREESAARTAPTPPVPPAEPAKQPTLRPAEFEALAQRIDRLEELARSALQTAEAARSEAKRPSGDSAPTPAAGAPADRDEVRALEGRIDELGDELRALREKLEAPKTETRAPKEDVEARRPESDAKKNDPAAIVVVAHSLQKALERGAPFAPEFAALTALGADPASLSALARSAESGAPAARELLASFRPLARQIEAADAPKPDAPIADKLLHGVGKLVKVRPAGDNPGASAAEIAAKVEAALERDDLRAAIDAFDALPDDAKQTARAWRETAERRIDAEKAAAAILSNAIAALGKSKS